MRVRLGAVGYLNARPLVHELDPAQFAVRFDVPSRCATLLHEGVVDLGLIPSIEFLRGDYRIVPDVAIASDGPVTSVALFSTRPVERIRSIALDTSSRTSAALLRVLCAESWGIRPEFVPHPPDLAAMLIRADAALLIGDPALFTNESARGLLKVDLGTEWTGLTGLPFVWAFWAGRPGAVDAAACTALQQARDRGIASVEQIAHDFGGGDEGREATARAYLSHHIRFDLGPQHEAALTRYYASAAKIGLVSPGGHPLFYADAGSSQVIRP